MTIEQLQEELLNVQNMELSEELSLQLAQGIEGESPSEEDIDAEFIIYKDKLTDSIERRIKELQKEEAVKEWDKIVDVNYLAHLCGLEGGNKKKEFVLLINNTIVEGLELIEAMKAKRQELDIEAQANEYKELRASEYPSIADQLDDLYHNGIDGWKQSIKAIKDKYPKN